MPQVPFYPVSIDAKLRFWPLQLGGWLAFGVAMGLSRLSSYPLPYMLATKSALALLGLLVSLVLRAMYRRMLKRELPLAVVIALLVTASYVAAIPWTAVYNVVDANIFAWFTGQDIRGFSYTSASLYHAFVLVAWSVLYYGIRQYAELQDERERLLRTQALATAARLSALRYQLNPHFLYNTLNAISTLVIDHRTTDATRMIARLSDLLRVTLKDDASDEVPLADEIAVLRQYLEIERVRFGDRLQVSFDVSAIARQMLVPALILQPLVENAIRHGIACNEKGGAIHIAAVCERDVLRITVDDDGPGLVIVERSNDSSGFMDGSEQELAGCAGSRDTVPRGIGLSNCSERLRAHYGDHQRLLLGTSPSGGTRITIELPLRAATQKPAYAVVPP